MDAENYERWLVGGPKGQFYAAGNSQCQCNTGNFGMFCGDGLGAVHRQAKNGAVGTALIQAGAVRASGARIVFFMAGHGRTLCRHRHT